MSLVKKRACRLSTGFCENAHLRLRPASGGGFHRVASGLFRRRDSAFRADVDALTAGGGKGVCMGAYFS